MDYGVAIFFTDYSIGPVEMGAALEERGFESLWAPEHSHIPLTRKSAYPQGGELPKKYYDVMDPFVTLTAAAVATKALKVGTGICLVVQRDPIQTAKSVASLDQISRGRFLFGIGAGWNEDEMADHGTTDFKGRFGLLEERVQAMRTIWTQTKPEFDGAHVRFGPMMTWPKPVQKPLPVIVGGRYPHGARRAIAFGDGWMPHATRPEYGDKDILAHLPGFRDLARAAGRDPATLPVTTFGTPAEPDTLKRYRDAGIQRVVFSIASEDESKTLATLDRLAAVVRQAD
jgi:probable F420-dependent oxidoreductase